MMKYVHFAGMIGYQHRGIKRIINYFSVDWELWSYNGGRYLWYVQAPARLGRHLLGQKGSTERTTKKQRAISRFGSGSIRGNEEAGGK